MDGQEKGDKLRALINEAVTEAREARSQAAILHETGGGVYLVVKEQTYWRKRLAKELVKTDAIHTLDAIIDWDDFK